MTEQDVWNANKRAILSYVPAQKDLKLIWEERSKDSQDNQRRSNRFAILELKILFRFPLAEE